MAPPKPPYSIAGTRPAEGNIEQHLPEWRSNPRQRMYAVVELRATDTNRHHPDDEPDEVHQVLSFIGVWVTQDPALADQLAAMVRQLRAQAPGQGALDDEAASVAPSDGGNEPI